jgi:drug/metabolite transporter (DMT)-like permease
MFEGLKTATPVSAAAVFTLTPAITAVFAWFILGQVTSRWSISALVVGAMGAVLVIFQGDVDALKAFDVGRGEQIYFVGCVSHALFLPLLRKFNRGEPVIVATLAMIVAGSSYLLAFGIGDLLATDFGALPMLFWIALAYLAVFASAATVFLLQYGAMNLPSANVMAYTYLTPIWVMFVEMAFGDVMPRPLVWLGIGATIMALLMLLRRDQKVESGPNALEGKDSRIIAFVFSVKISFFDMSCSNRPAIQPSTVWSWVISFNSFSV